MQYLKFSSAHFTIFSETERERLHGHNYHVKCRITAPINYNGMIGDYRVFKAKLVSIVSSLDEYTLIAGCSPYLKISQFDDESIAKIENTANSLRDYNSSTYKEVLLFLYKRRQSSYLLKGWINAGVNHFLRFMNKV
jgi:6-pyruvoyl-tetrahydropterin synthase